MFKLWYTLRLILVLCVVGLGVRALDLQDGLGATLSVAGLICLWVDLMREYNRPSAKSSNVGWLKDANGHEVYGATKTITPEEWKRLTFHATLKGDALDD